MDYKVIRGSSSIFAYTDSIDDSVEELIRRVCKDLEDSRHDVPDEMEFYEEAIDYISDIRELVIEAAEKIMGREFLFSSRIDEKGYEYDHSSDNGETWHTAFHREWRNHEVELWCIDGEWYGEMIAYGEWGNLCNSEAEAIAHHFELSGNLLSEDAKKELKFFFGEEPE